MEEEEEEDITITEEEEVVIIIIIIDMVEEAIIIITTEIIEITTTTEEIITKTIEEVTEMKDTPEIKDMTTEMIDMGAMGGMKTNIEEKDNKAQAAEVTVKKGKKGKRKTIIEKLISIKVMKAINININTIITIKTINKTIIINNKDGMVEEIVVITTETEIEDSMIITMETEDRMIIIMENIEKVFTIEGKGIRVTVMRISKEHLKGKDTERTHLKTKKKIKDLNEILVISNRNKDQDQRFKTNPIQKLKIRKFQSSQIKITSKTRGKLKNKF